MEALALKIARLETELEERKVKRNQLEASDPLYIQRELHLAFTAEIAEKQKTLNIYLESQKGKFSSPISVVLSHSYR